MMTADERRALLRELTKIQVWSLVRALARDRAEWSSYGLQAKTIEKMRALQLITRAYVESEERREELAHFRDREIQAARAVLCEGPATAWQIALGHLRQADRLETQRTARMDVLAQRGRELAEQAG